MNMRLCFDCKKRFSFYNRMDFFGENVINERIRTHRIFTELGEVEAISLVRIRFDIEGRETVLCSLFLSVIATGRL